jgi:hypothetical protein
VAIVADPIVPTRSSLASLADLRSAVADWLNRTDLSTERLDEFISLTEVEMMREVLERSIETVQSGTTDGNPLAFPTDAGRVSKIVIEGGGWNRPLSYVGTAGDESTSSGAAYGFTLEEGEIRLSPTPDAGLSYRIYFTPQIVPLSETVTTNWLLTNHPDVYLWGACAHASIYLKDDAGIARFAPRYENAKQKVSGYEYSKRFPLNGGLRIRTR